MRNGRYNLNGKRVIVSRTDSLGDVVLTLPVAAILKRLFPQCQVIFLGRSYTRELLNCCENIDEVADWETLENSEAGLSVLRADAIIHVFPRKEICIAAKKARIPLRLGTTNRMYHWGRCNKLVRLSRRHSPLHESQLNLKLLVPLGAKRVFSLDEIPNLYALTKVPPLSDALRHQLDPQRFNLILHPGSKGSAREWGLENFSSLMELLPKDKYRVFVTGTREEGERMGNEFFSKHPEVVNLCGQCSLSDLICFIANTDGMVAGSTGPLHIASATGRSVIGLYPPIKPMHPGRWAPVGSCAYYLVANHSCSRCRKKGPCHCMLEITPEMVRAKLAEIFG